MTVSSSSCKFLPSGIVTRSKYLSTATLLLPSSFLKISNKICLRYLFLSKNRVSEITKKLLYSSGSIESNQLFVDYILVTSIYFVNGLWSVIWSSYSLMSFWVGSLQFDKAIMVKTIQSSIYPLPFLSNFAINLSWWSLVNVFHVFGNIALYLWLIYVSR